MPARPTGVSGSRVTYSTLSPSVARLTATLASLPPNLVVK